MGFSIPGSGLVKKGFEAAKDTVGKVKDAGSEVAGQVRDRGADALDTVRDSGTNIVDTFQRSGSEAFSNVKEAAGDVVEIGKESFNKLPGPIKGYAEHQFNFAAGVYNWGKDTVDTVAGIVKNPIETAKGFGKLATNPVLNPVGGTAAALIRGENPVEAFKNGASDLKDIGGGLISDYKQVYDEHGISGVAGYLAPDIALAVATGGTSAGARSGASVAARTATREVAEGVAGSAAREVTEEVAGGVARQTAKDVGKEFIPGPTDVGSAAQEEKSPSFVDGIVNFFSSHV